MEVLTSSPLTLQRGDVYMDKNDSYDNPKIERLKGEIHSFSYDKVWITKKVRMNSENRLNKLDSLSQFLLNWYSISTLALSVVTLIFPDQKFDILNLIISIFLMGITLIVTSAKLKDRANEFKISYIQITVIEEDLKNLELQCELFIDESTYKDIFSDFIKIKKKYISILDSTPNQEQIDYDKYLYSSNKLDNFRKVSYLFKNVLFYLLIFSLSLIPLLLIYIKMK